MEYADAADRLILDESARARADVPPGALVVIGDETGALTIGAAGDGARGIRVHQDSLVDERVLAARAEDAGVADAYASHGLDADLLRGARVVLVRLPRAFDALRDIAGAIAAHADPEVAVFAGGRLKHMSVGMNDVLRTFFDRIDVTHARQKSRVLIARGPHDGVDPVPRRAEHDGIVVCAYGGVFAGTALDIGTRVLIENLPAPPIEDAVIDLACGSGVVAASLALRHPDLTVHAFDDSAAAVASARATAQANGVADRMTVTRDDLLGTVPDASASFIALNPPFHTGGAVTPDVAPRFFRDAARVLRPGGELWAVWNSGLGYRKELERIVGRTRQVARTPKFTVTVSTRR